MNRFVSMKKWRTLIAKRCSWSVGPREPFWHVSFVNPAVRIDVMRRRGNDRLHPEPAGWKLGNHARQIKGPSPIMFERHHHRSAADPAGIEPHRRKTAPHRVNPELPLERH